MFMTSTEDVMPRLDLLIAAHADVDRRSAQRALREGAAAVRGRAGERIAEAALQLGIQLPGTASTSAPADASSTDGRNAA
jgi:hypothetical protein